MPMAPRPSSPTISYLPALVTVSISKLDCLEPARLPCKIPESVRAATRHQRRPEGLTALDLGILLRLRLFLRHASADTRALYLARYPAGFLPVNATGVPVFRTRYLAVRPARKTRPKSFKAFSYCPAGRPGERKAGTPRILRAIMPRLRCFLPLPREPHRVVCFRQCAWRFPWPLSITPGCQPGWPRIFGAARCWKRQP